MPGASQAAEALQWVGVVVLRGGRSKMEVLSAVGRCRVDLHLARVVVKRRMVGSLVRNALMIVLGRRSLGFLVMRCRFLFCESVRLCGCGHCRDE